MSCRVIIYVHFCVKIMTVLCLHEYYCVGFIEGLPHAGWQVHDFTFVLSLTLPQGGDLHCITYVPRGSLTHPRLEVRCRIQTRFAEASSLLRLLPSLHQPLWPGPACVSLGQAQGHCPLLYVAQPCLAQAR